MAMWLLDMAKDKASALMVLKYVISVLSHP
jgi:hypothetical protein